MYRPIINGQTVNAPYSLEQAARLLASAHQRGATWHCQAFIGRTRQVRELNAREQRQLVEAIAQIASHSANLSDSGYPNPSSQEAAPGPGQQVDIKQGASSPDPTHKEEPEMAATQLTNSTARKDKARKAGKCQLCNAKTKGHSVTIDYDKQKVTKSAAGKAKQGHAFYCTDCADKKVSRYNWKLTRRGTKSTTGRGSRKQTSRKAGASKGKAKATKRGKAKTKATAKSAAKGARKRTTAKGKGKAKPSRKRASKKTSKATSAEPF